MQQLNSINKKNLQKQAEDLANQKNVHFDKIEIEKLLLVFTELTKNNKRPFLDRNQFRDLLHEHFRMTEEILMDRVFRAFDADSDSLISMKDWVLGLSIFLRGSLEEKTDYSFRVYDLNGDGFISREEMFQLLKNCLVKQPAEEDPDEGVKELVEITLKKMDIDKNSKLSKGDFESSVQSEQLLLEAFGKCLPDRELSEDFEHYIFGK
ncbi:Oidioi.mRNA.OKI2018_I69.chr1.g2478.t1.cds [Oikopleura dioica]|uniref:Oidioi.mRNA.OKI2018_I69.chr1.g2478.t1.cds n=1 Tax=Oikopleura dioica TaxID=34765 RepID=A0ABN7SWK4_OIKDI|nr:Oidioi.mRNA.OKI2018_I69.chr1.g2478.t1.cds [Oikopleura dioica]